MSLTQQIRNTPRAWRVTPRRLGMGECMVLFKSGGGWVLLSQQMTGMQSSVARRRHVAGRVLVAVVSLSGASCTQPAACNPSPVEAPPQAPDWSRAEEWELTSGSASDEFGNSVGISGDSILVGDPLGASFAATELEEFGGGLVHVFAWSGSGYSEGEPQKLLSAPEFYDGSGLGWSIAASDTVVLVGSPVGGYDYPAPGSLYAYRWCGSVLDRTQKVTRVDVDESDGEEFGISVAVWGDTAVVGGEIWAGRGFPTSQLDAGEVYVLSRAATRWTEAAVLIGSDSEAGAAFGWAVAVGSVSGGGVVRPGARPSAMSSCMPTGGDCAHCSAVGAPGEAGGGAAYVFTMVDGAWQESARLAPPEPDPEMESGFGWAVAVVDDTVFVAAPNEDFGAGVVHVFRDTGSGWSHQAELTASSRAVDTQFGMSVATDGTRLVVGAPSEIGGAVYVFDRDDGAWHERARLTPSTPAPGFGLSVGIRAHRVVVSTAGGVLGLGQGSGRVFVFVAPG